MTTIDVTASVATETTTGVEGALDVDVTVEVDGVEYDGEVTLVRHEQTGDWGAWGRPDNWVSGDLLRALGELSVDDFSLALTAIETAARESCEVAS